MLLLSSPSSMSVGAELYANSTNADNNVTIMTDEKRNETEDLLVVIGWAILAGFGLITNLLILFGIFSNVKLRRSTSYWLIISLAVCDISMLLVSLGHLLPSTAMQERYVGLTDFGNAFGIFVYDAFWYTGVLHLMIMALNRYVNICRPKLYLRLFSDCKTLISISVAYALGVLIAAPGLFECCYLVFNYKMYAAQYEPADTPYTYLDLTINALSIVIMTFCYTCIVLRVRRSRIMLTQYKRLCREQSSHHVASHNLSKFARLLRPTLTVTSRREVRLFFQFATVSVIFFLSFATWNWLPRLSGSKWVGLVVTSLFFLNNSTNPTVYLIFNATLRKHLKKLICIFKIANDGRRNPNVWMELKEGTGNATFGRSKFYTQSINNNNNNHNHDKSFNNNSIVYGKRLASKRRLKRLSSGGDDGTSQTDSPCNLTAITALFNSTALTASVLVTTSESREDDRSDMLEVATSAATNFIVVTETPKMGNKKIPIKCIDEIDGEFFDDDEDDDEEDEQEEEEDDEERDERDTNNPEDQDFKCHNSCKDLESPSVHL